MMAKIYAIYGWVSAAAILAACSTSKKINTTADGLQQLVADSAMIHAHIGVMVADAANGKVLAAYQAHRYFVPASNTKLWTMYAGIKYLGDSLVAGYVQPLNDTVLLLQSAADPTFLHPEYTRQPLANLLKKYREIHWINPALATTAYGNGWSWNDYEADYMAPRSTMPMFGNIATISTGSGSLTVMPAAAASLLTSMPDTRTWKGLSVSRKFDAAAISLTPGRSKSEVMTLYLDSAGSLQLAAAHFGNRWLAAVQPRTASMKPIYSQPTDSMLRPLMHRSDNFFAEQTLQMLSQKWYGVMNERAVIDSLLKTDFAGLPEKPRWVDGSGLSRYNLFSPADYIWLLQKMKAEFPMQRLQDILPTGNDGTLTNYYKTLEGKIFAKTGTLGGVVALSGYLQAKSGRQLLFSVLVNNHNGSAPAVRRAVEKYLLGIWDKY